uniref:Genome polyprotein n=1 Tax=Picornavirales sp. TaxID=1955153 RepID=A0A6M9Z7P7_9VIRU|nr:MAG: polyprotein [Picornavirales sp.]
MDSAPHGETGGTESSAGNVVLEQEAPVLVGKQVIDSIDWLDFTSSDTITKVDNMTNRWINFANLVWSVNDPSVEGVWKTYDLPKDIFTIDKDMCNTPNFMPFKLHAYSHFDLHLKFMINSNKFQTGCLQFAWIYQTECDSELKHRANMYILSQTNHVRAYAGSGNEVDLYIPFKNSLSCLFNQKNTRVTNPLMLGRLYISVINCLKVGTAVSMKCNINIQARFVNAKFTGMRAGNLPQMEPASVGAMVATMGAMRLLDTYLPDPNRDNPPLNAESPYFVPTASHSWSAGTGRVDIPKLLRLDTRGQTHHPPGSNVEDAFTVDNIKNKFGLLSIIPIVLTSTNVDSQLYTCNVEPMFGKTFYKTKQLYEAKYAYSMPPISVLSSMFMYWRGEIDFQFDIVCSQFHTFKMLVAYIPNAPEDMTKCTRAMAECSPHVVFSVEGPKIVNIRVPYVSNQRWWPRSFTGKYSSVSAEAPSKLVIFCVNAPLRQNSAADTFYVNVYVKGGPSFEVSVPVQPCIGLASTVFDFTAYPVPPTQWREGSTEINRIHIAQQSQYTKIYSLWMSPDIPYVDHHAIVELQFQKYKTFDSGKSTDLNRKISIIQMKYNDWDFEWYDKGKSKLQWPQYGTLFNWDNHSTPIWAKDRKSAFKLSDAIQNNSVKTLQYLNQYYGVLMWIADQTDYTFTTVIQDAEWSTRDFENYPTLKSNDRAKVIMAVDTLTYLEMQQLKSNKVQAGEREEPLGPPVSTLIMGRSLRSTNMGHLDFGESFNDLLVLCRRYQLYARLELTSAYLQSYDKCSFYFSCNPAGLGDNALSTNLGDPNYTFNMLRDGIIPILLSGYRYFRGGLRFRLVFPACEDTLIWIQHRPDRPSDDYSVTVCSKIETGQSIFNHGYAYELQLANINSVVEFEVPFYQYDHYGLLQCGDSDAGEAYKYQYGLGHICVGIKCSESDRAKFLNRYCEIYYALADDFSPSVFYGFPEMIMIDDLPNPDPVNVRIKKRQTNMCIDWVDSDDISTSSNSDISSSNEVQMHKVKQVYNSIVTSATDSISEVATTKVAEKLNGAIDDFRKDVKMHSDLNVDKTKQLMIVNIVTTLCHTCMNMSVSSICTSVVSIFVTLGIFVTSKIEKIFAIVKRVVSRYMGATKQKDNNVTQGPDNTEKSEVASWFSCLFGGITTLFAVKGSVSQPEGKKLESFLKNFSFGLRGANALFTFIQNSFTCISKIFKYIASKICPEFKLLRDLEFNSDYVNMWIKECLYLTDPLVVNKRYSDKMFVDRVYSAYDFGCIFIANFASSKIDTKIIVEVHKLFNSLQRIRADLVVMGEHPHVRKEPFGVYVFGEAGIGKSKLREQVCIEMLKAANFNFDSVDVFCVVNASDKHWNQCRGQPVLVLDDLWNIQAGEAILQQVEMMYRIFSCVILCPPKAAVEDKSMRYNPAIVWMNSNYSRVSVNGVDDDAINRRRNIVIEAVKYNPEHETFRKVGCPHCLDSELSLDMVPPEYLADFHHMRFFIHKDKLKPEAINRGNMYTYSELVHALKMQYVEFNNFETSKFNESVKIYRNLIESVVDKHVMDIDADDKTFAERYKEAIDILNNKELQTYNNYRDGIICRSMDAVKDYINGVWMCDRIFDYTKICRIPNFIHKAYKCSVVTCPYYIGASVQMAPPKPGCSTDEDECLPPELMAEAAEIVGCLPDAINSNDLNKFLNRYVTCYRTPKSVPAEKKDRDSRDDFMFYIYMCVSYKILTMKAVNDFLDLFRNFNNFDIDDVFFKCMSDTFKRVISAAIKMFKSEKKKFDSVVELCREILKISILPAVTCVHYNAIFSECVVIDGNLSWCQHSLDVKCYDSCLFNVSSLFKHMFYLKWVSSNYVYYRFLRSNKLDMLPSYFSENNRFDKSKLYSFVDDLKQYLTHVWLDYICPAARYMWSFIKNYLPHLLSICTLGAALYTLYDTNKLSNEHMSIMREDRNLRKKVIANQEACIWDQPESVYDPSGMKHSSIRKVCSETSQAVEVVDRLMRRNTFYLSWTNIESGSRNEFRCFSTGGRVGVVLRHYVEQIEHDISKIGLENFKLGFYYPKSNNRCPFIATGEIILDYKEFKRTFKVASPRKVITNVPSSNIIIALLPKIVAEFPNLLKFIATSDDILHASGDGTFVFGDQPSKDIVLRYEDIHSHAEGEPIPEHCDDKIYSGPICMNTWWRYNLQKPGYCGSVILANNLERPIVGIHVGGNPSSRYGIGEVITKRMFLNCPIIKNLNSGVSHSALHLPDIDPFKNPGLVIQSSLTIFGCVPKEDRQYQPRVSNIVPSLLHGLYPVETRPNPLSRKDYPDGEVSDPLSLGISKHGMFVKNFDPVLLDRAYQHLRNKILTVCKPIVAKVGILSDQIVVCGDPAISEWDALAWDTSVGYPLKKFKPPTSSGKKWCFDLNETDQGYELLGYNKHLADILTVQRAMRRRNIKPFTVFVDCLKDTCIPIEKCKIPGKTRIFSISPIQYTIEYKKYFGNYLGAYRRNRIKNESAIGINPDSWEWTQLVHYLMQVGNKFIVGDYKNFGPGLNLEVVCKALQISVDWNAFHGFGEEDLVVCRILNEELSSRYHLAENVIYYPPAGAPSGGPSTDILNTKVNGLYIRCAWMAITGLNLEEYDSKVRVVFYGDDLIMCVSDDIIDVFNGISISKFFSDYNIIFTDISKDNKPVKYKNLFECDFIKRRFVPHPFMSNYLAPVDIKSVHSCLNWCHNSLTLVFATLANLQSFRELMFGHGPDLYDKYMDKVLHACLDQNLDFKVVPWVEINERNYSLKEFA